jgi:hypothetical protein
MFEASLGKKLARPHLDQYTGCGGYVPVILAVWEAAGGRMVFQETPSEK